MRRVLVAVLCLSAMMACERSKVETLQARLDKFRNVLPPDVSRKFDSQDYPGVAAAIDSLIQVDPQFRERYRAIKHDELIDIFSSQEVVDFYREHFVEEIERLKQTREGNW